MKTIMNVLSNNTVCLQYIYDSFILRHLQFHFAGHWELGGTWTARNGNYCDPKAWSFYKQQPKEHWNCHRGRGSHHRTWRYCEGLLCPPWLDLRTESRLSQTAEVHLWGIPKTFLGTGWFRAVKVQSLKSKLLAWNETVVAVQTFVLHNVPLLQSLRIAHLKVLCL